MKSNEIEEVRGAFGPIAIRALAVGAQSVGAIAVGAVPLSAVAIGFIAIGRLVIGRAKIKRLEIGELRVTRLHVTDAIVMPNHPRWWRATRCWSRDALVAHGSWASRLHPWPTNQ